MRRPRPIGLEDHGRRGTRLFSFAARCKRRWPVRPTWMKPDKTRREATGVCSDSDLPGWLGTARVKRSEEEPGRTCRVEAEATTAPRGVSAPLTGLMPSTGLCRLEAKVGAAVSEQEIRFSGVHVSAAEIEKSSWEILHQLQPGGLG
jgi:hypothetical protein